MNPPLLQVPHHAPPTPTPSTHARHPYLHTTISSAIAHMPADMRRQLPLSGVGRSGAGQKLVDGSFSLMLGWLGSGRGREEVLECGDMFGHV